jgi:hypothetical protein
MIYVYSTVAIVTTLRSRMILYTELYRINRERHRFLGNEAENQQFFVAFAAPSNGQIWQIY